MDKATSLDAITRAKELIRQALDLLEPAVVYPSAVAILGGAADDNPLLAAVSALKDANGELNEAKKQLR